MPPRILFLLIILLLLRYELMASDSLCVEKIAQTNHHYKHFISHLARVFFTRAYYLKIAYFD